MATIEERPQKNGTLSYRVSIRRKGVEIQKTFKLKEDAELYGFYKDRLIDNMENFEVPIDQRISLKQIMELKLELVKEKRARDEIESAFERMYPILPKHNFAHEITYNDWLNAIKKLHEIPVYQGVKKEKTKRMPSISSIRRWIANLSSAFSYAISLGINIENHPMKVMQSYINPLMNNRPKLSDERAKEIAQGVSDIIFAPRLVKG